MGKGKERRMKKAEGKAYDISLIYVSKSFNVI